MHNNEILFLNILSLKNIVFQQIHVTIIVQSFYFIVYNLIILHDVTPVNTYKNIQ